MLWAYCLFLSVQNIEVNAHIFWYSSEVESNTLYETFFFLRIFFCAQLWVMIRNYGSWNISDFDLRQLFVLFIYTLIYSPNAKF